jgi:hypothetical protein
MEIICCVTMDVEVDKDLKYWISNPPGFRNVTEAIPELLEPLFLKYGVKPTYLISSEVMQHPESVKILSQLQSNHELGTHGHGEFLGEGIQVQDFSGAPISEFIYEYPYEVQRAKLAWLTELFTQTFGYPPRSFRGGRFGIDVNTLKILANLHYEVDSSVTPGNFYKGSREVVNFILAPEQPYRPAEHDLNQPGELNLFEIPVSCWTGNSLAKKIDLYLASRLAASRPAPLIWERLLRRTIGRKKWLRPTLGDQRSLIRQAKQYLRRHSEREQLCINIMFHPIELVIGASPYSPNQSEVNRILNNLESLIKYFAQSGCSFAMLKEVQGYMNNPN